MKESLDRPGDRRQLTPLQNRLMSKVCSITGSNHARQHHSPPRYGEEKGRRRPSRDQECAAHLQPESARTPHLGGGVEEIRAGQSDGARLEDDQQERRLRDLEKGRPDRGLVRRARRFLRLFGRLRASADCSMFFGRSSLQARLRQTESVSSACRLGGDSLSTLGATSRSVAATGLRARLVRRGGRFRSCPLGGSAALARGTVGRRLSLAARSSAPSLNSIT